MSNVIAFPRAFRSANVNTDSELTSRREFDFDMSQHDQAGLVLIDACVPDALAREVAALARSGKFCCDATIPDARGFVLLDACVSWEIAVTFSKLLSLYADSNVPATAA
jgi:hypothetical protein